MAVTYQIDGHIISLILPAECTRKDFTQALAHALGEVTSDSRLCLLVDLSLSIKSVESDDLRWLANYLSSVERLSKCCALTVSDPVRYGLCRMFSVFAESHGITASVFKDIDEARQWLEMTGK
jgi:hypothetical protein